MDMSLEDQFKLLVGGYYGVQLLDEYSLKEFILQDIEEYIKDFIQVNPIPNYNYKGMAEFYNKELTIKTKYQDALIVLHKIKAPMEVVLLVKKHLKIVEDEEKKNI